MNYYNTYKNTRQDKFLYFYTVVYDKIKSDMKLKKLLFPAFLLVCCNNIAMASDFMPKENINDKISNYPETEQNNNTNAPAPLLFDMYNYPVQTSVMTKNITDGENNILISIINNLYLGNDFNQNMGKHKCPFETKFECDIWLKKPTIKTYFESDNYNISENEINNFITSAQNNSNFKATDMAAAPILKRYKKLMRYSTICCTGRIINKMKSNGASYNSIYNFLTDDLKLSKMGNRCIMMTPDDLDQGNKTAVTKTIAFQVKNKCLCNNKKLLANLLNPFKIIYEKYPAFENNNFNYTYTDKLDQEITVSINSDILRILADLEQCN